MMQKPKLRQQRLIHSIFIHDLSHLATIRIYKVSKLMVSTFDLGAAWSIIMQPQPSPSTPLITRACRSPSRLATEKMS
jgi:hypothetical protein